MCARYSRSSGGKDVVDLLDAHFTEASLGTSVMRLVDFWLLIEKLGKATTVLFGSAEGSRQLAQWKLRLLNTRHAPAQILRELIDSGHEWERAACARGRRGVRRGHDRRRWECHGRWHDRDELIVTGQIYDHAARLESFRLFAQLR